MSELAQQSIGESTSHVKAHGSGFRVDRTKKLGSIVANELILDDLERFLAENFSGGGARSLLDLGAGTKPYAPVYAPHFSSCTAVDVPYSPHDISSVDVLASADDLPFEDGCFDCVLCIEVLEHCAEPAAVLSEVARVLVPGGRCFLSTPFLVALHEMPHDYYRFTPSAIEHLARRAGLEVEAIRPKGDYGAVALGFLSYPWAKFWQALSNRLRIPLYHPANPVVWVTLVLPQLLYLVLWRRARRRGRGLLWRLSKSLSYTTLGYVTILARPDR